MKVLVIGNGGREHALCWKLAQSPRVTKIFAAPGNPGTALCAENVSIAPDDIAGLKAFAAARQIDLTIVGPEVPLTLGIVDEFEKAGLKIFGPSKRAAELEGSKIFCKGLLVRNDIPTARYKRFDDAGLAAFYLAEASPPFVIKADGLAAGKGVFICANGDEAHEAIDAIMNKMVFGGAGRRIIIEELLEGREASFLAITDGKSVIPLAPAEDHKRIYDNDTGPNTGGMGAYSPTPAVTPELEREIMQTIMIPAVRAMAAEGRPYKGVLYAGLMITPDGRPKVLEFNCRFGDPETQPILTRLDSDLFELLMAAAEGRLEDIRLSWNAKSSVCVVMASGGYPDNYEKGKAISGLDEAAELQDVVVFHAGTAMENGLVVTSGGRVLGVTALGDGIQDAINRAYEAVEKIYWDGVYYRTDIGRKAL
ncbi:MAG: phosphoribosylamine--glycine ligase [Deltaproteobacteria bacterium]|nr:phosphoribosylamine--glycine ligase [Deltaproteobacteria bacterium]